MLPEWRDQGLAMLMNVRTVPWLTAGLLAVLQCNPLAAQSRSQANALPAPGGVPVQVYRGLMDGEAPSWIELADLGDGRFVLSILDGVPGLADHPQQLLLTGNGRKGSGCMLSNGNATTVQGCPNGKAMITRIAFGKVKRSARITPIALGGAYGYTGQALSGSQAPTLAELAGRCTMRGLAGAEGLVNSSVPQAISDLQAQIGSARTALPGDEALARLRSDRRSQFSTLTYTPYERERMARMQVDPSRMFDFRLQMVMAEQRRIFLQQIDGTPARQQARQRLAQIEAELAAVYDPAQATRGAAVLAQLATGGGIAGVDRAVAREIAAAGSSLSALAIVRIEKALAELEQCNNAMAQLTKTAPVALSAAEVLTSKMLLAADNFRETFGKEVGSGGTSAAWLARLNEVRGSKGLMKALDEIDRGASLLAAEAQVAALARREETRRLEAARAAETQRQRSAQVAATRRPALASAGSPASTGVRMARTVSRPGSAPTAYEIRAAIMREGGVASLGGLIVQNMNFDTGEMTLGFAGMSSRVVYSVSKPTCKSIGGGQFSCSYVLASSSTANIWGISLNPPGTSGRRVTDTFRVEGGQWRSPSAREERLARARENAARLEQARADEQRLRDQQRSFYCPGNGANPLDNRAFC